MDDEELVRKMVAWVTPRGAADVPNPYAPAVVARGESIVPTLLRSAGDSQALDLNVVSVLGQIGSPAAFEVLLSDYAKRPIPITAISAGACLDKRNVSSLFSPDLAERLPRSQLLASIYGEDWDRVKNMRINEIERDVGAKVQQIAASCKERSRPVGG